MDMRSVTLIFDAEEEGIDGKYRGSDIQFTVTLDADSRDHLQVEGETIVLKRLWQESGLKDGEAGTEFSLSSAEGVDLVNVSVELLEAGCARAAVHWPNTSPTREIIGFCDNWRIS